MKYKSRVLFPSPFPHKVRKRDLTFEIANYFLKYNEDGTLENRVSRNSRSTKGDLSGYYDCDTGYIRVSLLGEKYLIQELVFFTKCRIYSIRYNRSQR